MAIARLEVGLANLSDEARMKEELSASRAELGLLRMESLQNAFFEWMDRLFDWAKWAAPAGVAIALLAWMVGFMKSPGVHDKEIATLEKLVFLLFGGFLGWGAPRKGEV